MSGYNCLGSSGNFGSCPRCGYKGQAYIEELRSSSSGYTSMGQNYSRNPSSNYSNGSISKSYSRSK